MNRKLKNKILLTIVGVVIIGIAIPVSAYAYNNYYYEKNYQLAIEALNNEEFDDAINYIKKSLEYNSQKQEETDDLLEKVKVLQESKALYEEALQLQSENHFIDAINLFRQVPESDEKYFSLAQEMVKISTNEYVKENIHLAQVEAEHKNYDTALSFIDNALELEEDQAEALLLKEEYTNELVKIEQQKIAEQKVREAKNIAKSSNKTSQEQDYKLLYKTNSNGYLDINATLNPNYKEPLGYVIWDLEIYIKDSKIYIDIKNSNMARICSLDYYITVTRQDTGEVLFTYAPPKS